MTDTLVLYHGSCPDGFTAAWAAFKKLGPDVTYQAANFHDEDLPDVTGKRVYIVDFSYPRDTLIDMSRRAKLITILDHHRTAQANLEGLNGLDGLECHFDMDRSGAGMSWDYFHPNVPRSILVSYVEDRDIWNWKLPNSKELNAVVTSHPFTFENWDMLSDMFENRFEEALAEGRAIRRSKDAYVRVMKHQAMTMNMFGWEGIPVINAPHITISELLHELAKDALFALGWRQTQSGRFVYSLRSKTCENEEDNFDVSLLAKALGGGGHLHAAGFDSDKPPWELASLTSVKHYYENPADSNPLVAQPEDDMAAMIESLKGLAASKGLSAALDKVMKENGLRT